MCELASTVAGCLEADVFLRELPADFNLLKADLLRLKLTEPGFREKAYLLDLRGAEAHARNGLSGSLQCLLHDLPEQYSQLMPEQDKEVIIYCNGGMQSLYAVMYLKMRGYANVRSLAGGYAKYLEEK